MIQMIAQFGGGLRPNSDFFGGEQITTTEVAANNVEHFVSQILGILTLLAGLLFIFYFVLGAFRWISAGGDSGNTQKARDQMTQAVIGMILVVASYSIIGLVGNLFGFNILSPAAEIINLTPTSSSMNNQPNQIIPRTYSKEEEYNICLDVRKDSLTKIADCDGLNPNK
jgi:hypothetical protein